MAEEQIRVQAELLLKVQELHADAMMALDSADREMLIQGDKLRTLLQDITSESAERAMCLAIRERLLRDCVWQVKRAAITEAGLVKILRQVYTQGRPRGAATELDLAIRILQAQVAIGLILQCFS